MATVNDKRSDVIQRMRVAVSVCVFLSFGLSNVVTRVFGCYLQREMILTVGKVNLLFKIGRHFLWAISRLFFMESVIIFCWLLLGLLLLLNLLFCSVFSLFFYISLIAIVSISFLGNHFVELD